MAKVSITNQHDYMRFIINFGAVKITGNFNRYDHTIKLAPFDGPLARAVSEAIDYVMKFNIKTSGDINPGQLFDVIKPAGERAKTPEQFLEFFKSDIEKAHGIVIGAFEVQPREKSTSEALKDGRGWKMEARFENGDFITVKSSGKTVSMNMTPPITALMDEAMTMTFGYVGLGADAKTLVEAFAEQAAQSSSTEAWIENCRLSITPAAVMKR
jgi:hypothetical protein